MKIAIDVREASGEKTGKGFFAFGLVSHILAKDRDNKYILYTDKPKSPFETYENVELKSISKKGFAWHYEVLKDLKNSRPDVYLSPTSFIVPAFAPKWLKIFVVVHDLVAFKFTKHHSKKAILIERTTLKRVLRRAYKTFVVSENTRNDLIKLFKYPKSMMVQVPCGLHDIYNKEIDQKISEKIRKKQSLPDKFILGVGTLEPRKNFINLIKAFVTVKRKFPDYKLVIVGKQGWRYKELHRAVKQFELENDVIFTGYIKDDDLHHIYNLAEVFVFPSLYEGFGLPPLEAMASGCPVIASNTSSLPEVIGEAGLLIEPTNSHKIADGIISLIENPQLRNMLLERGFHHAKKYSWDKSAEIVLEEFSKIKEI